MCVVDKYVASLLSIGIEWFTGSAAMAALLAIPVPEIIRRTASAHTHDDDRFAEQANRGRRTPDNNISLW